MIEFLLPFTGCRKVLGKMAVYLKFKVCLICLSLTFKSRPWIIVKKSYHEKWQAKWAIKLAAGWKSLVFAWQFSEFCDSFNPIQTAFCSESMKILCGSVCW